MNQRWLASRIAWKNLIFMVLCYGIFALSW